MVREWDILSLLKGLKDFILKKSTVIIKKMFSEIILLIGYTRPLIPFIVQNVID